MQTKEFEHWIEKHKIIKRTQKSFLDCMKDYKIDEPEEFLQMYKTLDIHAFNVQIDTLRLSLSYKGGTTIKYVSAVFEIIYKGEHLGYYDCIFNLDGDIIDDYLRTVDYLIIIKGSGNVCEK